MYAHMYIGRYRYNCVCWLCIRKTRTVPYVSINCPKWSHSKKLHSRYPVSWRTKVLFLPSFRKSCSPVCYAASWPINRWEMLMWYKAHPHYHSPHRLSPQVCGPTIVRSTWQLEGPGEEIYDVTKLEPTVGPQFHLRWVLKLRDVSFGTS